MHLVQTIQSIFKVYSLVDFLKIGISFSGTLREHNGLFKLAVHQIF